MAQDSGQRRITDADLEIWRERHQILYQLVLDIMDELSVINQKVDRLEQRLGGRL